MKVNPKIKPAATPRKARVFIADDHQFFRFELTRLINAEADMTVCGEAGTLIGVRSGVESTSPDVLLTELYIGESGDLDFIKSLRAEFPKLRILILSHQSETVYAERALRAGAHGYLMKEGPMPNLLEGIRTILAGDLFISHKVAVLAMRKLIGGDTAAPMAAGMEASALSDRELQVFRLLGAGKGTKEIAEVLKLSPKTAETYRENIKHKLGFTNATALTESAAEWVQRQTELGK